MGDLLDWYNNPETQKKLHEVSEDKKMGKVFSYMYADMLRHIEEMGAAYLKHCNIPPNEVELVIDFDITDPLGLKRVCYFRKRKE